MKWRIRLQAIRKRNGETVYMVYLPKRLVEELGWDKGDELVVEPIIIGADTETGKE